MAEGMRSDAFLDVGKLSCLSDSTLQCVATYVVAADNRRVRVNREARGGEDELPDPLSSCHRVFAFKRLREINCSVTFVQILLVNPLCA